jgi:hypothetical protein
MQHLRTRDAPMDSLLMQFRDNKRFHDDLHLWLEGYSCVADSYYLAFDGELLPGDKSANKVRRVLIRLLGRWSEALAQATSTQPAYLPYDFSDQYTGCFQCRPDGDAIDIVPGSSNREGWSLLPSNPGDYFFGVTDFQRDAPSPIRLTREEFVRRIRESIADAEAQLAGGD